VRQRQCVYRPRVIFRGKLHKESNNVKKKRSKKKEKRTDSVLEMRNYPLLITKLRFRSALVRDLSSICFLKSVKFRLAHGSREKDEKGKKKKRDMGVAIEKLILGKCANTLSSEPIVFTLPSNVAILRIDLLFIHVFVLHEFHSPASACPPCLFHQQIYVNGIILGQASRHHAIPKRRVQTQIANP